MRGDASPEVWRTTFEYSPGAGASWTSLGAGIRIPGGWQLTGLALPANSTFQACGYTETGQIGGSGGMVEMVLLAPLAISGVLCSAGQLGFSAMGPFGQVVVLEASPDLQTWTPLQTNTLSAGPSLFTDPQRASLPARFYRLRAGP
jgi:hypothetical protein